jgi:hypothetical protein
MKQLEEFLSIKAIGKDPFQEVGYFYKEVLNNEQISWVKQYYDYVINHIMSAYEIKRTDDEIKILKEVFEKLQNKRVAFSFCNIFEFKEIICLNSKNDIKVSRYIQHDDQTGYSPLGAGEVNELLYFCEEQICKIIEAKDFLENPNKYKELLD